MRRFVSAIVIALLFAGSAAGARADMPSPSQFTLKVGGGVQSNAAQSLVFAAGADYAIIPATKLTPVNVSLYADLFGKSGGGGIAVRNTGNTYVGAGLGYYSVSITPPYGGPAGLLGPTPQTTFTGSGAGGKVFAGFSAAGLSFELGYHFLPNAGSYQTNTVTAQLALHL
jgi:hypothetical protein